VSNSEKILLARSKHLCEVVASVFRASTLPPPVDFMTQLLTARRFALQVAAIILAVATTSRHASADVVGPGSLTASSTLAGAFGPGQHSSASPLGVWDDILYAIPGINDPSYRVLFTIVFEGSNPASNAGGASVTSHAEVDLVTFTNILSKEFSAFDPQFTSRTIVYSMPLYIPGFPATGTLTEYRMLLQSFAVVFGSTGSDFSTSSNFGAYIQSIRAVDGEGNDITSQIGLRSASGFMGTAPEPSTFVLMAGGLLLLPMANSSFRKRLFSRGV
jgi:hypothetical protein